MENARETDFDDRFGLALIKRAASDDDFGFMRLTVFLALNDTAREDDVFEIKDCEVFIFQFSGGVKGYETMPTMAKDNSVGVAVSAVEASSLLSQ